MTGPFWKRWQKDKHGVAVIEFAIVAPVMLLLVLGFCDLAYTAYVGSILTGAMQKSGRDSMIQGSSSKIADLDSAVIKAVRNVAPSATYVSSRKNYAKFGNISPEYFTDANANGRYDSASECFTDVNGNNTWDTDPGTTGQGGANDVTVYTMTIEYPRMFPMYGLLGWPQKQTASSTTILKNQPYASQSAFAPKQVCP